MTILCWFWYLKSFGMLVLEYTSEETEDLGIPDSLWIKYLNMPPVNFMVSLEQKYWAIAKQESVSFVPIAIAQRYSKLVFTCWCCVDFITILWANTLLNASVNAKTVISVFFQLLLNFCCWVCFVLIICYGEEENFTFWGYIFDSCNLCIFRKSSTYLASMVSEVK